MSCREEIGSWTFATLVGAFVDLAIAHLLLCCAAVVYFAERFLDFFGFELPCPCVSVGNSSCIRGLLANGPVRIASVLQSVWNAYPFDSVTKVGLSEEEGRLLLRELKRELASDAPPTSMSVASSARLHEVGSVNHEEAGARGGKRRSIPSKPLRLGIQRRRREAERRKCFPNSRPVSPCSNTEISHRDFLKGNATHILSRRNMPLVGANEEYCGNKSTFNADFSWTSTKFECADKVDVDGSESKDAEIVRNLKLALNEARVSCCALYHELEKERSAAAIAADEAMAVIEHLKKEKSSVEMNARQYKRSIEEKMTYDEDEINILKEIVVRRERELHILEKEVEMYREMMSGNNEEAMGVDNGTIDMSN